MRFQSILVLTYGRTGSTLLMGVLNTIPGVLVRGENQNMFAGLFQSYRQLRSTQELYNQYSEHGNNPFYGAHTLSEQRYMAHVRALARDQLVTGASGPVDVYGFKEVRYTPASLEQDGVGSLAPYLDFLAQLFPNPAFLVLTRAHDAVVASSFWRKMGESEARRQMMGFEDAVGAWARGRQDVIHIDYDDALADPQPYSAIFDFLGAPYDVAKVQDVLSVQHSDDNRRADVVKLPWS